jgi:hypothetical protein
LCFVAGATLQLQGHDTNMNLFVYRRILRNRTTSLEDVMKDSPSYLRRGLLGAALVGALGFGASQALAVPRAAGITDDGTCVPGDPGSRTICRNYCQSQGYADGACLKMGLCGCIGYIGP